jgi:hypothetical protein
MRCPHRHHARVDVLVEQPTPARRVPQLGVQDNPRHDQIQAVDADRQRLPGILAQQGSRQRDGRDQEEKKQVPPQEGAVRATDVVHQGVVAHPEYPSDQKTDTEGQESGPELPESQSEFLGSHGRIDARHPHIEDEQCHGDGEDAIGQRLDAIFADAGGTLGLHTSIRRPGGDTIDDDGSPLDSDWLSPDVSGRGLLDLLCRGRFRDGFGLATFRTVNSAENAGDKGHDLLFDQG